MRVFIVICTLMIFIPQTSFSMYGAGYMYATSHGVIGEDELFYDKEQRMAIRRHNETVVQQRIEMADDFWEGCSEFFSFFKRVFSFCWS